MKQASIFVIAAIVAMAGAHPAPTFTLDQDALSAEYRTYLLQFNGTQRFLHKSLHGDFVVELRLQLAGSVRDQPSILGANIDRTRPQEPTRSRYRIPSTVSRSPGLS